MNIIAELKTKVQVQPGCRYVVRWHTSYNYTTKTSRRRGGYNRTRTSIYFFDQDGWSKNNKKIDNLSGLFCPEEDYKMWLVPVPDFFFDNANYEVLVEEVREHKLHPIEKLKYCQYHGTKESAEFLSSFSTKNKLKEHNWDSNFKGTGFCSFDLFFPQKDIQKNYNPYTKISFSDGEKIEETLNNYTPCNTWGKLILVPKETQLSLF